MTDPRITEACPFCGRVDRLEIKSSKNWGHFVRCANCKAVGSSAGSREGAIAAWNNRPEPIQGRLL